MPRRTEPTSQPSAAVEPHTLFFVHIPKTAGSTFQQVLARLYEGDPRYCNVYPNWEEARNVVTTYGWGGPLSAMAGHFPFGLHRNPEVLPLIQRDVRCITFLREPVRRVVSQYNHVMNSDVPEHQRIYAEHPTLESFLDHPWARNIQVYFASGLSYADLERTPEEATRVAIANIQKDFACFGLTERFDESLILFSEALGWPLPNYTSTNLASDRASRIRFEDLPPDLLARIATANQHDRALYQAAADLFNRRLASVPRLPAKLAEYRARLAGARTGELASRIAD